MPGASRAGEAGGTDAQELAHQGRGACGELTHVLEGIGPHVLAATPSFPPSHCHLYLFPNIPQKASSWEPEVAWGRHPPSRAKTPALPDSGPRPQGGGHQGGGIPAGIPLLLDNLSISCRGCKFQPFPSRATSGLCRLPGPMLTLAGDRTVLVLPAPSLEPAMPSTKPPAKRALGTGGARVRAVGRGLPPHHAYPNCVLTSEAILRLLCVCMGLLSLQDVRRQWTQDMAPPYLHLENFPAVRVGSP